MTTDEMAAEIERITAAWVVDDRPTKFPSRGKAQTYISQVPAALNCVNRAAKLSFDADALYDLKYQVMLICARLGWARDCSGGDGYRVDRYMFHLVGPGLDCSHGNEVEHRNLDTTKVDDLDRALAVLEVFVAAHPLTEEEHALLAEYREEQAEWQERASRRLALYEEFGDGLLDDDDEDDLYGVDLDEEVA